MTEGVADGSPEGLGVGVGVGIGFGGLGSTPQITVGEGL